MLAVNAEKFLKEYLELLAKHEQGLVDVEESARSFAVERNYDGEKANAFVEYVKSIESDGLSKDEQLKFEWFKNYLLELENDNIPEPAEVNDEVAVAPTSEVL